MQDDDLVQMAQVEGGQGRQFVIQVQALGKKRTNPAARLVWQAAAGGQRRLVKKSRALDLERRDRRPVSSRRRLQHALRQTDRLTQAFGQGSGECSVRLHWRRPPRSRPP